MSKKQKNYTTLTNTCVNKDGFICVKKLLNAHVRIDDYSMCVLILEGWYGAGGGRNFFCQNSQNSSLRPQVH